MATFRCATRAVTGTSRGGPLGRKLFFPFNYIAPTPFALRWWAPFALTQARAVEWWWRFQELQASLAFSDGSISHNYAVPLTRVWAGSETDLKQPGDLISDIYGAPAPGPFLYSGVLNDDGWDGGVSTLDLAVNARLFAKTNNNTEGADVDHLVWSPDGSVIAPSVLVEMSFNFTTSGGGSEQSYVGTNAPIVTDKEEAVSVMPGHGGGSTPFHYETYTILGSTINLTISPSAWFTWNGKWNAVTGARV